MARAKPRKKPAKRKKAPKRRLGQRPASAGTFLVKGHTRSPRGPDKGKKPVRVPPHRRRNP